MGDEGLSRQPSLFGPEPEGRELHIEQLHSWQISYRDAVALQRQLRDRLIEQPVEIDSLGTVAGVDVSSSRGSTLIHAAAVVLDLETMEKVDSATASVETRFPYIPGLLSFREGPAALAALGRLSLAPDIVIFDGQGYAHPRRLGLAAHMGLWIGLPSLGCAKTRLIGQHAPPPYQRGEWTPLVDAGETIGAVLTTREGVKPVFISRGHLCDLESAIAVVMTATGRFRLPEPIRRAHSLCNEVRINSS